MQTSYIIFFVLFIIIFLQLRSDKMMARQMTKQKDPKERLKMLELARRFIGKECIVYTFNSSQLTGTVQDVTDGGILLTRADKTTEAVNADFIIRIREYPKKANGKKKSVVLD